MESRSEIVFSDARTKESYIKLCTGRHEEKQLKEWLDKAFLELEKNAFCGIQIPKKQIPKEYLRKAGALDNLWKYNLPGAWRLIYTIKREKIIIFSIVLEWMNHKDYEKRFRY